MTTTTTTTMTATAATSSSPPHNWGGGASSSSADLPSTMQGPPICNLVEPGKCQLGADPVSCKLIKRWNISPTSCVVRFELPDKSRPLDLSTCSCILAKKKSDDSTGEDVVVRPYTPISTNSDVGYFDLLVKKYPNGKMSTVLHEMPVGDHDIGFFHIDKNVKIQAPFDDYDTIVMLVGGTGITPMIQALHAILGADGKDKKKVVLLYGSKTSDDILGHELLHRWAKQYPDRFSCVDILSDEPQSSSWKGERGYIDEDRIGKYAPSPSSGEHFCFFVCGPPPMYSALCGPREEQSEVKGLLGKMGYKPEQVYKF